MAREKYQTLTEQMFYILLCLGQERCGADVMAWISETTHQRVAVGPGTLYNLLEQFLQAGVDTEHALVTLSSALALRGEDRHGGV